MTLRARLTLFFVGIVVVPLALAAFGLRALVDSEVQRRTNTRLEASARGVAALWSDRLALVGVEVGRAARHLRDDLARDRRLDLRRARAGTGLDFLVVTRPGQVVGAFVGEGDFLPGFAPPSPKDLAAGEAPSLTARVEVVGEGQRHEVVGGVYADADLARSLQRAAALEVAIVWRGRTVAATFADPPHPPAVDSGETASLPGGRAGLLVPVTGATGQGVLLVSESEAGEPPPLGWAILVAGLLAALVLGWSLARVLSRPLERLAEGARAVSAGNLDLRLEREGEAEAAKVADAFNTITTSLQQYVEELKDSRDELRRGLERLGATLRSTHDLDAMLGVVLDSAATTLGAGAGAVFLLSGRAFRMEVAKAFHPGEQKELRVGRGVAGRAALGSSVLFPGDPEVEPDVNVEPVSNTAVAVPLTRGERIIGVLALYHRVAPEPFDREDAKTLASFATQASVAIENVLLHREAQRLSITDGLTGVWNRRYLQLTLAKEIDRAQRFGRPLSVLMVDIDYFKGVNDRFGHPRGDEVLVELSRRILAQIRTQIDFLTRYGGEEFVVALPETPADGAMVVAQKIRQAIGEEPFLSEGGLPVEVTVSIGAATYPEDGSSLQELVEAADRAMYRAKEGGRDRVEAAWASEG